MMIAVATSMRVLVAGDTHGNLSWITTLCRLARRHGCDRVLQLGDFGLWPDLRGGRVRPDPQLDERWISAVARAAQVHGVSVRFVDGNHDAHPLARAAYDAEPVTGLRVLRPGVVEWADRGAVWEWAGVHFGALGGAVSTDRQFRTEEWSWWATETTTTADLDTLVLRAGGPIDVLVAHDAPAIPPGIQRDASPELAPACAGNRAVIAQAVSTLMPRMLLHGHYHHGYATVHDGCRVEGFASDVESRNERLRSWAILDLPELTLTEAVELR